MANYGDSKFKPLTEFLVNSNKKELTFSFCQIEDILGFELCPSARKYSAYWQPSRTHTLPLSWKNANYELINLDMISETLTLKKI